MIPSRMQSIIDAIWPYSDVANFHGDDVMAAAMRTVPDVEPEEVSAAFDLIDRAHRAEMAELQRREIEP